MRPTTVIAIHPAFAWLVDWSGLAVAGTRWYLVTGEDSHTRLASERRLGAFAGIATTRSFDVDSVATLVDGWVRTAGDPAGLRFVTAIEQIQLVAAALRERYGAPGATVADLLPFTHKPAMKRTMRGVDALLPRYIAHDRVAFARDPAAYVGRVVDALGLPVFAKPVAENSSAGVARLDSATSLRDFLETSPHELELDEYVEGDGFHLDAIVTDGQVRWFGAGLYACPQGETLKGGPLAGLSIEPRTALFEELRQLNETLLGAFPRVPDGTTHLEVLRRRDGRWVFLEVAARAPGVRCPEMHELVHGVDLRVAHYQVLTGGQVTWREPRARHAGYYCPMKTTWGRLGRVVAPPFESPHTGEWSASWQQRTDVARTMAQADCLGYFVFWNDDRDAIERDLARLHAFRPYDLA